MSGEDSNASADASASASTSTGTGTGAGTGTITAIGIRRDLPWRRVLSESGDSAGSPRRRTQSSFN